MTAVFPFPALSCPENRFKTSTLTKLSEKPSASDKNELTKSRKSSVWIQTVAMQRIEKIVEISYSGMIKINKDCIQTYKKAYILTDEIQFETYRNL